jgi:hypothetical protein
MKKFEDYYKEKIDENILDSITSVPKNLIGKAIGGIKTGYDIIARLGKKTGAITNAMKKISLGEPPKDKKELEIYKKNLQNYKKPNLEQIGKVVKNVQNYTKITEPSKAADFFIQHAITPEYKNWAKAMISSDPKTLEDMNKPDINKKPPVNNNLTPEDEKKNILNILSNLDIQQLRKMKNTLGPQNSNTEINLKGLKYMMEKIDNK